MNCLLDTNHWSYLQRREASVVSHIQSLPDAATLYMPVVAQAELLAGVELAVHEPRKQELQTLYAQVSPPYTFFLLNGNMELNRNRQIFV